MQSCSEKLAAALNLASLAPWVLIHLLLLAAIQGITEFIPVSSSGHLQLVHGLTAFPDHGLAVDVALHAGTLLAVMAYFYRDVGLMLVGARNCPPATKRPGASRSGW
ncbi:MAG: hypothetical protein CM15mP55_2590 [Hyphomicrobiales bacterium]|nr:MAG: hypothetical protein CM15mP55_2590 [Hyphomicrobiales bacterium]